MGTRADFYKENPVGKTPEEVRTLWLGSIAFDGHHDNFFGLIESKTQAEFVASVYGEIRDRDDYADPEKGGYPFPWTDDIFITDVVYFWHNGQVYAEWGGDLVPLKEIRHIWDMDEKRACDYIIALGDAVLKRVPTPIGDTYDRSQPDSISMISLG